MAGSLTLPDGTFLTALNFLRANPPVLAPVLLARERVLITGASGFIGTNLLEFYRAWDAGAVVNFDINPPRNPDHDEFWHKVDICDAAKLRDAVIEFHPTVVFHLAARTDLLGNDVSDYKSNSEGVRNLVAALRDLSNRPRLIVASSRMVCDIHYTPTSDTDYAPSSAYGESKVLTEVITRRECGNGIPWILVRPTGIWGPWFDIPYRNFFEVVRRGLYFHPKNSHTRKSYGFVGNVVHQLDRLMYSNFSEAQGHALYVTDPPTAILPWAKQIADTFGAHEPIEISYSFLAMAAKIGDMLKRLGWRNPPLTSFRLANLTTDMVVDYMLAETVSGNGPYTTQDATDITIDWLARDIATAQKGL